MNINNLKKKQREILSKKRLTLSKKVNLNKNYFYKVLESHNWFDESKIVASFLSIKSEIPSNNLNRFIESAGKILCLPIITNKKDDILVFRRYSEGDDLKTGKFNIKEPLSSKSFLPDIIFTPCLGFDEKGYRLGYGGGYYDKTILFLKNLKHHFITIGLAYDDQKIKNIKHDHLDQRLDYILTEKQLYKIL
tara:strand:- start:516 stop:1091 length:576 start_codon:yes stop_codon:yes gene_type:complete